MSKSVNDQSHLGSNFRWCCKICGDIINLVNWKAFIWEYQLSNLRLLRVVLFISVYQLLFQSLLFKLCVIYNTILVHDEILLDKVYRLYFLAGVFRYLYIIVPLTIMEIIKEEWKLTDINWGRIKIEGGVDDGNTCAIILSILHNFFELNDL